MLAKWRRSLESLELIKIKGIPLRVHPSWFLILTLFTWTAQGQLSSVSDVSLPAWLRWGIGLITALLLFLSVLLHELGHSFVALNEGVKVESITLFLLGGVARLEKECSTAMGTLRVAAAGPLVSILLAIILLRSVPFAGEINPFLGNLFAQIGLINLLLALFNLIPGLPLDGGVILKAIIWQLTGSQEKGIQVASASGRFIALFFIVFGLWISFKGGGLSGLWLIMIGWFGLSASRSQSQLLTFQNILCELNVKDASNRRFRVLEDDQTLRRLSQVMLSHQNEDQTISEWVLVCHSGRWIGYVTNNPLRDTPVQHWDKYIVRDFIEPIKDLPSISEKLPLWKAILALEQSPEGKLLVFNTAGLPSSTLDRIDVGEAVLKKLGLKNVPKSFLENARKQNIYPLGISLPKVVESMLVTGKVKNTD